MRFIQQINEFRNDNRMSFDVLQKYLNNYISRIPIEMRNTIQQAVEDACVYHNGQKRADDQDYIVHVLRVAILYASITEGIINNSDYCIGIIAALLHDTLEDTDIDRKYISRKYGDKVLSIIDLLTSKKENDKETIEERRKRKTEKWQRLYSVDNITLWVHVGDVCDNAISWRNLSFVGKETKISRWLFQVKEYSIPLFEKRFPDAVTILNEEIAYQHNRGIIEGDWYSL